MKSKILENKFNLLKILQFLLFIIYIYCVIISVTLNNINDFIMLLKSHLLIAIFIIAGFIDNEKINNTNNNFIQRMVPFYTLYFLFYLFFLICDDNYAINKSLIPIEIFGIQAIFLNINFGEFYNAIYLATYIFISRSLYPLIIEQLTKLSDKYKYILAIFLIFFGTYLYKENYYNNIYFYVLLYIVGIIMCMFANNVNLKKIKMWQRWLLLIVCLFYMTIVNISNLRFWNCFSIIVIIVIILIVSTINIKFYNIINYRYIFMISSCFSFYFLYFKNGYLINVINKINISHGKHIIIFVIFIAIAVILSFFLKIIMHYNKILIYKIFVAFFMLYVICMIIVFFKDKPILTINNGNEMISLDNYIINFESNINVVDVSINNNTITTLNSFNGKYEYKIDSKLLNDGWNYIEFKACKFFSICTTDGGVINNLGDKPSVFIPNSYVKKAREMNKKHRDQYYLDDDYDYYRNYIGAGNLTEGEPIYLDNKGIPRLKRNGVFYYQPVFVTAVALDIYKDYLETKNNKNKKAFLNLSDWLIENNDNGRFEYPIDWAVGNININAGWSSAMAQGRALSVLSRAYYLTKDIKYLKGGSTILNYMLKTADNDIKNGTSKKLYDFTNKYSKLKKYNNYRIFETYVTNPSSYSLNGDLFALLGLYDWYRLSYNKYGSNVAKTAFDDGIKSIEVILPYYDYYGWSSYDLLQYTNDSVPHVGNRYAHRCHLQLLYILYTKTKSEIIKYYVDQFKSYYDDDFWIQDKVIYKEK